MTTEMFQKSGHRHTLRLSNAAEAALNRIATRDVRRPSESLNLIAEEAIHALDAFLDENGRFPQAVAETCAIFLNSGRKEIVSRRPIDNYHLRAEDGPLRYFELSKQYRAIEEMLKSAERMEEET